LQVSVKVSLALEILQANLHTSIKRVGDIETKILEQIWIDWVSLKAVKIKQELHIVPIHLEEHIGK